MQCTSQQDLGEARVRSSFFPISDVPSSHIANNSSIQVESLNQHWGNVRSAMSRFFQNRKIALGLEQFMDIIPLDREWTFQKLYHVSTGVMAESEKSNASAPPTPRTAPTLQTIVYIITLLSILLLLSLPFLSFGALYEMKDSIREAPKSAAIFQIFQARTTPTNSM